MSGAAAGDVLAWVARSGGRVHDAIRVVFHADARGATLCAAGDIAEGSLLMRVPFALCVSGLTPSTLPGVRGFVEEARMSPFTATCVQLMHEVGQGTASRVAPYLAALPRRVLNSVHLSSAQRAMLRGTCLDDVVDVVPLDTSFASAAAPPPLPLPHARA